MSLQIAAGVRARLVRVFDWQSIVFFVLILILIYQVAIPLGMIIWTSLKLVRPGDPAFLTWTVTLDNYVRAFGHASFWATTWNTLAFSGAATVLAFVLGTFLAWVLERTDTPLARLIGLLLIGRMIIPSILSTIAWILVASPGIGMANRMILNLSGIQNLFNIYSFGGMVWVAALEMVPLTYLLLAASFKSMDPRLVEASTMSGAGTGNTLGRIELPLALPAIGAAILLLFINAIETFEVPLIIGTRAGIHLYTSEIYFDTARTPTDWGLSSTYAVALLAVCIGLLLIYSRAVRFSERFQTITGKDFRPRRIHLGYWRYLTCLAAMIVVFLITGVPLLTMLYASLLHLYQPPSAAAFATMTLENYRQIFDNAAAAWPLLNSLIIGTATATLVVLLVSLISYFVHKTKLPGRKLLDFAAFSSIAIPNVVLGAAFLWFYLLVPIPILGTLTIIVLAYITLNMPFALRFISTSMTQIHPELEEAALMSGGTWGRYFFSILLPLLKPGLLAAWFWVVLYSFRELTISLTLAQSQNRTAAVLIYNLWETGSFLRLCALGVVMFAVLVVLLSFANTIGGRYGVKEL